MSRCIVSQTLKALGWRKSSLVSRGWEYWENRSSMLWLKRKRDSKMTRLLLQDSGGMTVKEVASRSPNVAMLAIFAAVTEYDNKKREGRPSESILTRGETVQSGLGPAVYVRIWRHDNARMGWEELQEKLAAEMPGTWAVQVFPPDTYLVNAQNAYHLWALAKPPVGLAFQFREEKAS